MLVGGPPAAIARPGRSYDGARIRRAAAATLDRAAEDPAVDGREALGRVLAEGAVVGVLNEGSEISAAVSQPKTRWALPRMSRGTSSRAGG